MVHVRVDFRRHHRVAVRLPGTLVPCGTKHVLASLTVTSLSVSGGGFTLRTPLPVQSGKHYNVLFFLDDAAQTLIFETIVMRRVEDRQVGAEFCLEDPYHHALDCSLMNPLGDPEEA